MLYDRWWKRPGITCFRDDKGKEGKANALGVDNIGGVFVVLLGGLAVAIIIAIIEFCVNSRKNAQNQRVSALKKWFLTFSFGSVQEFAYITHSLLTYWVNIENSDAFKRRTDTRMIQRVQSVRWVVIELVVVNDRDRGSQSDWRPLSECVMTLELFRCQSVPYLASHPFS